MGLVIPAGDGDINTYNLSGSGVTTPIIYYVNGIRVPGRDHAVTASLISLLTERPVKGVYNKTGGVRLGGLFDLGQCVLDYMQNASARLGSDGLTPTRYIQDHEIEGLLAHVMRNSIVWNEATASLFVSLVRNRHAQQKIVAHSQGNLITSNALFAVERILGSVALRNIRVYSSSPSPGWPLGLRVSNKGGGRQENAFMNDFVALLRPQNLLHKVSNLKGLSSLKRYRNAGDFRTHKDTRFVGLDPHDVKENMALNFLKSIRNDLNLPTHLSATFLKESAKKAEEAIPVEEKRWWEKLNPL